jgi:hypothetical protein
MAKAARTVSPGIARLKILAPNDEGRNCAKRLVKPLFVEKAIHFKYLAAHPPADSWTPSNGIPMKGAAINAGVVAFEQGRICPLQRVPRVHIAKTHMVRSFS